MIGKIPKLPALGGIPKIGGLGKPSKIPRIPGGRIARPEGLGPVETRAEMLEARAMQGVSGTLPERLVWAWLARTGLIFYTQEAVFGGRRIQGGMTLDFVCFGLAASPVVLRVQGEWFHSMHFPGHNYRDDLGSARLTAQGYIVLDLNEEEIYVAALSGHIGRLVERKLAE